MKKKSLKDRLLSLSIISSILIGLASSFVVTYAAIINKFVAPNNLQYAVSGYSAYFASGQGIDTDPFIINESGHLRNLQKLNSLGAFNENTYFQLGKDFTYEGDALLPIGTDDMPFNSNFDGMGHTITNLVVNGANTRDVGMFGYVGINGKVSNMILNHPTINLTANTSGDYNSTANGALSTTNYLDSVLNSAENPAAKGLSNPKVSSSGLSFSNTTVTDTNGVSYPITYKSSDESLLDSKDNGKSFSVATENIDDKKFTTNLAMVHITASVQSIIDNNIMNYTLERFAVTLSLVKGTNSTSIEIKTDNNSKYLVEKTMWYSGEEHGTNVGFFVGHLDGGASYLGLYGGTGTSASETANGLIKLSGRKAQSSSCLIGKTRSDNPRDLTAKDQFHKDFNFQNIDINGNFSQNISSSIPASLISNSKEDNDNQTNTIISNIATQNENAIKLTKAVLKEIESDVNNDQTGDYIRLFPTADVTKQNISNVENSPDNRYLMKIRSGLSAGTYQNFSYTSTGRFPTYYIPYVKPYNNNNNTTNPASSFFGESSVWIWATSTIEEGTGGINGFISNLLKAGTSFDINFKISYIPRNLDTNNYFKILFNGYSNDKYFTVNSNKYTLPCTNYARWKDLSKFPTNNAAYNQASYPVLFDGYDDKGAAKASTNNNNRIIEQNITLTIDTTNLDDWGLKTSSGGWFSGDQNEWTPSLMFGIGTDTCVQTGQIKNENPAANTSYYSVNDWTGESRILGATISPQYTFESGCHASKNDTKVTIDTTNGNSDAVYFFKDTYLIDKVSDSKEAGIDILDLDITFSSSDGNESKLLNNVDFLDLNNPTYSSTDKTWTNWSKASKVKINFNHDFSTIAAESAIVYSFWRNKTSYGTNTVYGRSSNSTDYPLSNTKGFTNANLG